MHPGRLMLHLIEQQNPDILIDWDIRTVYFDDDELVLIVSTMKRLVVTLNARADDERFIISLQELRGPKQEWVEIDKLEETPPHNMANGIVGLITTNR